VPEKRRPKESQKRAQSDLKGAKGFKREPKGSKRESKGTKRKPIGCQKGNRRARRIIEMSPRGKVVKSDPSPALSPEHFWSTVVETFI
jgi:hypothetical protein